jgi:hypothetical protein
MNEISPKETSVGTPLTAQQMAVTKGGEGHPQGTDMLVGAVAGGAVGAVAGGALTNGVATGAGAGIGSAIGFFLAALLGRNKKKKQA